MSFQLDLLWEKQIAYRENPQRIQRMLRQHTELLEVGVEKDYRKKGRLY